MEKVIERIIELLPVPVIIACAAIIIVGYSIKELRDLPSEGAVLREPWFQICALVVVAATAIYYASAAILSHSSPRRFTDKERGILVAPLSGDKDGSVQKHTLAGVKEELSKTGSLSDVVVVTTAAEIESTTDATEIIERTKARAVVWGSFLPPEVVHYTITTSRGETRVAAFTFKDVSLLSSKVVQYLQLTPPPPGSATEDQVAFYKKKVDDLENQNQALIAQAVAGKKPASGVAIIGQPKVAVISVGVSNYQDLPKPRFAVSDAQALSAVFHKSGATVTTLVDANRVSILEGLSKLRRNDEEIDTVVFYFAGLSASVNDDIYLLPSDATAKTLSATAIPIREIENALSAVQAKHKVVILDASVGRSSPVTERSEYSLGNVPAPNGFALLLSTSSGESSVEFPSLNHGVFTYYILKGLNGDADTNKDGVITAADLFFYVRFNVARASTEIGFPQHPYFYDASIGSVPLLKLENRSKP